MASAVMANSPNRTTSLDDIKARIMPASQSAGPLKMCVYGQQKIGKTWFSGSSNLKTLIVDCREKGTETVADRPNVDVYGITRYSEIDDAFRLLHSGQHDYEVVSIDTISMLAMLCRKWVLGPQSLDPMVLPASPEFKQWNQVTEAIENVILDWRDLPYHVLFLAQERVFTVKNDEGDELVEEVGPALPPQASKTLLSAVGTIGRLYTEEVEIEGKTVVQRRMLVSPHERFRAGSRIKKLPRVIANPTLGGLLAHRKKHGEAPISE